jgi:hypothetical protein
MYIHFFAGVCSGQESARLHADLEQPANTLADACLHLVSHGAEVDVVLK